jgi:predicted helicase
LHKDVTDRPRLEVTRHLFEDNLALNLVRQTKADTWEHALVSDKPTPAVFLEIKDGSSIFPLYLYTTPEETAGTLFAQLETTRKPNLSPAFIAASSEKLGLQFIQDGMGDLKKTFGPEDVFHYAYAVFHSPTYRTRYAEFLKIDFPRLPLTSDKKLFAKLVAHGKELVELHLLKSPKVDNFITSYPEAGDNKVERVQYANKKVSINQKQYFGNVPEEVWEFKVGGYQVCEKWLKDRKGRTLSGDDITHYQRVVVSLKETIRLMKEINKAIVKWPME